MSRLPRIQAPGVPAHVVHRGNNRQRIFNGEADRLFFLHCLRAAAHREAVRIHAYVLMPNHVHLLMSPEEPDGLSRFMQSAARRYVGYFNGRYRRTGTLWEGRFHSTVIQDERYLFACHRYIDLNPVRWGLVATPMEHPWSSHPHYAEGRPDSLLSPHELVQAMATTPEARPSAYGQLFEAPQPEEEIEAIREATRTGRALGGRSERRPTGRPRQKTVRDTRLRD